LVFALDAPINRSSFAAIKTNNAAASAIIEADRFSK